MENRLLLSSAYLGPVGYFREINRHPNVLIEHCDAYEKRSYRNHCRIMTCNGPLDLTIPVIRPKERCETQDIQISHMEKWQQNHWRAIESAYNSSPFFEYYKEDYEPIFKQKIESLAEFNQKLLQVTIELLHIHSTINYSTEYTRATDLDDDMRRVFHPRSTPQEPEKSYYQVFDQKYGFQPNLSILDLLFNMGPEAIFFLQ